MRILKFDFSKLHNEEWFRLFVDFRKQMEKYGAPALGVGPLFALLVPKIEKADYLLVVLQKSLFTDDLEEAVKKRNERFASFYNVVKSSRTLPDDNPREAARRLYVLAARYRKNILNKSYSESSAAIYNLLEDLDGKYAADITLLGAAPWVNAIREGETDFQKFWNKRKQESVDKPKEHLRVFRDDSDEVYDSIMGALYGQLLVAGLGGDVVVDPESLKDGIYESDVPSHLRGNVAYNFVIEWNETLKKYHNLLSQRAGRRKKKAEADETPSAPEDLSDLD